MLIFYLQVYTSLIFNYYIKYIFLKRLIRNIIVIFLYIVDNMLNGI